MGDIMLVSKCSLVRNSTTQWVREHGQLAGVSGLVAKKGVCLNGSSGKVDG